MSDPISAIARYLSADVRALDTLSQNVANLSTPGYRALQRVPRFDAGLPPATRVNLEDGALIHTGRPLDLALQGRGFFVVQAADGRLFLTRSGQFQLNAEHQLTDAHGRLLMGEGGPITAGDGALRVDENGLLHSGTQTLDRLALVALPEGTQPGFLGEGLYAYPADAVPKQQVKVHQGALEGSNVDPAHEMVRLMQLTRHASSIQHAIAIYHSALVAGIDQLGKD